MKRLSYSYIFWLNVLFFSIFVSENQLALLSFIPVKILFFAVPSANTVKTRWLRSWFKAPPSWIVWKKYQLYWAMHERMWAMSTTSLNPNSGYAPLSPSSYNSSQSFQWGEENQIKSNKNSHSIASHPVRQKEQKSYCLSNTSYSNQQAPRFVSKLEVTYNQFWSIWTARWDKTTKNRHQFPSFAGSELWYC